MPDPSPAADVRPAEQLLVEAVPRVAAARIYCTSVGRAQFAAAVAMRCPDTRVCCGFLDLYQAQQAAKAHSPRPNLAFVCQADLPDTEFDLVAYPLPAQGDAELTRDFLQAGCRALPPGGELWAATDNPHDRWLHGEMGKLFDKVTCDRATTGVLYRAVKTQALKKIKDFTCRLAFRDRGLLIHAVSRPGVFSHRRLDTGARALIETLEVRPGERVLDLGCGSGVVTLAAAHRTENVHVLAVDANPRAVQCTVWGAERNGLSNVQVRLDADATCDVPASYDLVVANPPYFSRHRIAELFLAGADRALKPGGRFLVVTKEPVWFCQAMTLRFHDVLLTETRGYFVLSGRRP
jgi:16S rRNA G1207 methylase RsmC